MPNKLTALAPAGLLVLHVVVGSRRVLELPVEATDCLLLLPEESRGSPQHHLSFHGIHLIS